MYVCTNRHGCTRRGMSIPSLQRFGLHRWVADAPAPIDGPISFLIATRLVGLVLRQDQLLHCFRRARARCPALLAGSFAARSQWKGGVLVRSVSGKRGAFYPTILLSTRAPAGILNQEIWGKQPILLRNVRRIQASDDQRAHLLLQNEPCVQTLVYYSFLLWQSLDSLHKFSCLQSH